MPLFIIPALLSAVALLPVLYFLAVRAIIQTYRTPIHHPVMVGLHSPPKRCAYCHEYFDDDSTRRFCIFCGTASHTECAELNGGCSVYGCVRN